MRNKRSFWACAVLLAAGAADAAPRVPAEELRRMVLNREPLLLVDVRPAGDFAKGHIQGAVSRPNGEMGTPDGKDARRIVVYCEEDPCPLTDKAVAALEAFGHKGVSILRGGLGAWRGAGYPMVAGDAAAARPRPGRLAPAAVKARLAKGDLSVLDTRAAAEHAAGHIPGAVSAPLESLDAGALGLPKGREVLVYDKTAARARAAAAKLQDAGYAVFEIPGGIAGWLKKGNKLEVE